MPVLQAPAAARKDFHEFADRTLGALEGDATTPEDVGATSSSEESSHRVSETPYTPLLHRWWLLPFTRATPIGAESTSSTSGGMASAAVTNEPLCDDHYAARTGRFTSGSCLTKVRTWHGREEADYLCNKELKRAPRTSANRSRGANHPLRQTGHASNGFSCFSAAPA